ncbi:MAG: hypothetical protein ACR2JB_08310 [Bryobacteraceae bacterium]
MKSTGQVGIDISGTHYSPKLRKLIAKTEKLSHKQIIFEPNTSGGDNNNRTLGDQILIAIKAGSSEDDVAHELVHSIMQAEGYPKMFAITVIPESETIHSVINSDLDHLVINQIENANGYDALHGFLLPLRQQYQSLLSMRTPGRQGRERMAIYGVLMMHELMKHVYYIKSPDAESRILESHPELKEYWRILKKHIDKYLLNPSPSTAWVFATEYAKLMDRITDDAAAPFTFSEIIGFSPVSCPALNTPANSIFWVLDRPDYPKLHRIFVRHLMVGAIQGSEPDLSLSVGSFSNTYNVACR